MDEILRKRLDDSLDRESALALLRGAVSRESVTGNEANLADYLEARMAAGGLNPVRADFLPGRPNLWGERGGETGEKRLLFVGHTDTVHARGWRERWAGTEREDPFGGAVVDGELWGRGAGDLKAGICASLAAVELLDRAGVSLKGDVALAFVGDEESGEPGSGISAGIKDFARRVADGEIKKPNFAVYVEPTKLAVFPAQMGFFIAEVRVRGKSAYFGLPERGVDALKAAHKMLAEIWRHSDAAAGRARHDLVGRAFVLVTEIHGGSRVAVPGECAFSLIRKLLPDEDLGAAARELEAVIRGAAAAGGVEVDIAYPAGRDHELGGTPAAVDPDLPEIRALSAALESTRRGRGKTEGAPYWSESPFLINQIGCPAVYCAPGDIVNCHTLEERVSVDEYFSGIVAFAAFAADYCGVAGP